jgi:L-glyceraldehyde 3-phosphate reductase
MSLSWVLRLPEVTSVLIGASNVAQLNDNISALDAPEFSDDELAKIDSILG